MNAKQLADDARALNLSVETTDGRVRIAGATAEVKRAFVLQGFDARREGETGWSMWNGAACVAHICRLPGATHYAYGYTYAA